ncbi:MAG: hypothetical protein ABIA76_00385 [Candidatus Diapherotrites archaeon]
MSDMPPRRRTRFDNEHDFREKIHAAGVNVSEYASSLVRDCFERKFAGFFGSMTHPEGEIEFKIKKILFDSFIDSVKDSNSFLNDLNSVQMEEELNILVNRFLYGKDAAGRTIEERLFFRNVSEVNSLMERFVFQKIPLYKRESSQNELSEWQSEHKGQAIKKMRELIKKKSNELVKESGASLHSIMEEANSIYSDFKPNSKIIFQNQK